jgi:DNA-binding FadR family transcriptional regulator
MPKLAAHDVELSLRRRLVSGEWRQTRRLPDERQLATEYGVARNTVRAALQSIVAEGALTRQVGRGTFLVERGAEEAGALLQRLVGASPMDMMAVRMILEPRAAALAATGASAGELEAIAAAHAAASAAAEMQAFERWDAELHQRIFAATRNDLLGTLHELLRVIRNQPLWIDIKRRSFSPARRIGYCQEHAAIVAALMRRDAAGAAQAMLAHLRTVETNLTTAPGEDAA